MRTPDASTARTALETAYRHESAPIMRNGPFAETKELIAGHTIIDVKSRDEAVEWARKLRNPQGRGKSTYIEVRPFFELDDFEPGEGIDRFRELEARTR